VFSRGGASEPQPLELAAVADEALRMLRPMLPSTIEIKTVLECGTPLVNGDAVALQQVVMNLCINARDAMNERGDLELCVARVTVEPQQCASCHADFSGAFVELRVSDDGAGIRPEDIEHIFDPFFTTKDVGKGTGMGLSVVHGIVHRFGGHVRVESAPGRGCIVRVLLPSVAAETVAPERQDATPAQAEQPSIAASILVVDDDQLLCEFFAEMLRTLGYRVTAETDPIQALHAFERDPQGFDLVLTDQTMPGMSGKELTKALLDRRSDLPVIMCTGYSEYLNEQKAKALGAAAFFTKPVDMRQLLQTVNGVLNARRSG
jgi:CheY-like chemotaxis protein